MVARNPDSLLNQAKTILESSMDYVESDKTMDTVSEDNSNAPGEDNSKAPGVINVKKPRERRPDNDESLKSTQEANDHNIKRPTLEDAIPETNAMNFSPQTRVSDVKPANSSKVSELDELLSYDYEGLDEEEVQISTLNKHISRLTPLKDPFSPEDIVSSPEVCYFPQPQNKKKDYPDIFCSALKEALDKWRMESHVFKKASVCGEEDIGVSGEKLLSEERIDETRETSHSGIRENLFDIISPTDGEDIPAVFGEASLAGARKDVDMTTAPIEEDQMAASPKSGGKEAFNEGSAVEVNVNEGDGEMGEALNTQYISMIKTSKETVGSLKRKLQETEKPTSVSQENTNVETVNKARKGKAKSNAPVLKDKHEEREKTSLEIINEETVNKLSKGKARSNATDLKEPKNKKKKVEDKISSQLLSLNEAGSKWEEGVRLSTRIRMRPLEFWIGERILYGRVHESVVSAIGVKYASPVKNSEERVVMKVKSFVPDEYNNLLNRASSY